MRSARLRPRTRWRRSSSSTSAAEAGLSAPCCPTSAAFARRRTPRWGRPPTRPSARSSLPSARGGRSPGRDAPEATRLPYFSQVEGLAVDKGLTVGDMKGTLLYMIQSLYGPDRKVRVRPSYFPFTEPSFEFDVSCGICGGMGCKSCRHKGWLEVGGCGMVHPQVLRNGGIDPSLWNGYAWGFGIERMAMLKHDVDDIRMFYEPDLRFLEQF